MTETELEDLLGEVRLIVEHGPDSGEVVEFVGDYENFIELAYLSRTIAKVLRNERYGSLG